MSEYLLIRTGDKGEASLYWMDEAELRRFLADPLESLGCDDFYDSHPATDPEYWSERAALLLRVEILTPVPVTGFMLPLEQEESLKKAATTGPFKDDWLNEPEERLRTVYVADVGGSVRLTDRS